MFLSLTPAAAAAEWTCTQTAVRRTDGRKDRRRKRAREGGSEIRAREGERADSSVYSWLLSPGAA